MLEKSQTAGGPKTIADSLTGADGIKRKTTMLDTFPLYNTLPEPTSIQVTDLNTDEDILLPKTQALTGTASINCGINSKSLCFVKHKGLPPSLYDFVHLTALCRYTSDL